VGTTGSAAKIEAPGAEAFASDSEGFKWSGRQDLNLRPLGPEDPPGVSDTVGSRPLTTDVPGTTGGAGRDPSDTDRLRRLDPAASGTIQAQRTLGAPRLLTVREVALRLRVSRATVYRLVAEGRIPALRVSSGAVRIPEAALLPRQKQQSR
jgi:excisionase family DNA binding protein